MSERVAYPVSPGVAVQAGDVLGFYGPGIPVDVGGGGCDILAPPRAVPAPAVGGTVMVGGPDYPVVTRDRTYSFAATVLDASGRWRPRRPRRATAYGGVDAITLDNPGAGYTFPTVSIDFPDGPDGVQATAHVVCDQPNCNNNGNPVTIASVVVDNPGSGYSTAPGIAILRRHAVRPDQRRCGRRWPRPR